MPYFRRRHYRCVRPSTLREATDRGFECLTVSDACGSGDRQAHEAALHMVTVEDGVFGAVADSGSVIEALAQWEGVGTVK